MKGKRTFGTALALGLLLALMASLGLAQGPAPEERVDAAFTYQGTLNDGGSPANGSYDFEFKLYDVASGDTALVMLPVGDVAITDGLFTVQLDFGGDFFTGDARWLEIGVRPGSSTGTYTTLAPRQPLTAAPYALSLRPGAIVEYTGGGGLGPVLWLRNDTGLGLAVGPTGNSAILVGEVGGSALETVGGVHDGISIEKAGSPSTMNSSDWSDGFEVDGAEGYGLYVGHADLDGVHVHSTGGDGVHVYRAGSPFIEVDSVFANGFEVEGAEGDGLYVGWADSHGVQVQDVGGDGVHVQDAGGNGVYAYTSGAGSGVLGKSLTGFGVRGETSAPGRSGVYGWHGGNGDGVTGFSSSGAALAAVGTGVIYSSADSVLYLSPHDLVVRASGALPVLPDVVIYPLESGGARTQPGSTPLTAYLSLPISTYGALLGSPLHVKSVEVCYQSSHSQMIIDATSVIKNNGTATGYSLYLVDPTDRNSTNYTCYTVTATPPYAPIDNSTVVFWP